MNFVLRNEIVRFLGICILHTQIVWIVSFSIFFFSHFLHYCSSKSPFFSLFLLSRFKHCYYKYHFVVCLWNIYVYRVFVRAKSNYFFLFLHKIRLYLKSRSKLLMETMNVHDKWRNFDYPFENCIQAPCICACMEVSVSANANISLHLHFYTSIAIVSLGYSEAVFFSQQILIPHCWFLFLILFYFSSILFFCSFQFVRIRALTF